MPRFESSQRPVKRGAQEQYVDIREDLGMIGVANLLAGIDVNENGFHFMILQLLARSRRGPISSSRECLALRIARQRDAAQLRR
jgi:hypothetical protein